MPDILTCSCGVHLRIPHGAVGNTFRCPRCQNTLSTSSDIRTLSTPMTAAGAALCPICQSKIAPTEAAKICPGCQIVHHQVCWGEIGGCSTYGCTEAPVQAKEAVDDAAPRAAWGDTKSCPICGETIKSIALRCRYCGADFDTVDPLTAKDLRRGIRKEEEVARTKTQVVILFIMGLSGCLAPVALIFSPFLIWGKQDHLKKAGPAYYVLAYSTLALAVLYSLLFVLFAVYN